MQKHDSSNPLVKVCYKYLCQYISMYLPWWGSLEEKYFFQTVSISKFSKFPSRTLRATPQPSHIFSAESTSSAFLAALAMSFAAVTASTSWESRRGAAKGHDLGALQSYWESYGILWHCIGFYGIYPLVMFK